MGVENDSTGAKDEEGDGSPPRPLDAFLVGTTADHVHHDLRWDHGMWVGPEEAVNYPESGHDLLPVEPDNWWYGHRAAVVVRALHRHAGQPRVLWDVGGGTGLMEPALRAAGWKTVVVEPVAAAAKRAVDRADLVIAASLEAACLPDNSVSAIGMFDVLEHLSNPVGVLRECARILVPGGTMAVTVPSHQWLWSNTDEAAGHQVRYSIRLLRSQIELSGLSLVEARRFFVALVPGALVLRTMRRRTRGADTALAEVGEMLHPAPARERVLRRLTLIDRPFLGPLRSPIGLSLVGIARKTP